MINDTLQYAKELVSQMELKEKVSQMLYQSPAIERLGIPAYNWWNESLHGVARAGVATMFPQAIAMASTFDEELLYKVAQSIAIEGRAKHTSYSKRGDRGIYKGLTFWAPNINIFRDPRWGRGHETYGEDPYLTAQLGVAYVKGLQGEDKSHLLAAACAKHFAVHSGPEECRHSFDAVVSKKDMYETYLYAFKRLVKDAKVEAVMGAYNRVNGEPACGSKTLLQDILRGAWEFEGHVVSDCWAILDFHENHQVTNSVEESVALAVNNGCDLNCGSAYLYLDRAIKAGLIEESKIDEAVTRLLEVRIRLGMLEEYPSPYDNISYDVVECKEHVELSLEAARRSVVLLKNQDAILPLDKKKIKTIAVIGPNANSRMGLVGNYTGTSSEYITPLEGIGQYVGDDVRVLYAEGCHLYKDKVEELAEENDRIVEAKTVAELADVVVLCVGLDASVEGEQEDAGNADAGGDKIDLSFSRNQQKLMEAIKEVGKPVILLVSTGSAMDLKWADNHLEAILQTWYLGARGGKAIAQLLFGEVSPCGKLPITIYDQIDELPEFTDYNMKNRTYRYMKNEALYPFGYGLSYTNFDYVLQSPDTLTGTVEDAYTVNVLVENTGEFDAWESVQTYIKIVNPKCDGPVYQLRNIKTVFIEKGKSKEVQIVLNSRDFGEILEDGTCVVSPGEYRVFIGSGQPDQRTAELCRSTFKEVIIQVNGTCKEVEL